MATAKTAMTRKRAELERGIELGWHTGAQLFTSVGEAAIDLALGEARPGVAMTPATIVEWASATKAVTSCSVALLWERAAFDLDDPVCQYVPEFAARGKQRVTVRHLLTHTAGLTDPVDRVMSFGDAVAAVCAAPLVDGWSPGDRRAYCSAGMWILAELVARRARRPFGGFVREEMFEPLGIVDCWIGMPAEVYQACRDRIAMMPRFAASGTMEWVTWGRPTGGGHGPIGQLGRFYRALLERRLLSSPVIEAMTARHLVQAYDERLDETVDWGLGFCLASSYRGHGYGPYASGRAFGHGGRNWCVAFADPTFDLAAAGYWNGPVDAATHAERQHRLLGVLYEDLGLATAQRLPRPEQTNSAGQKDP